MIRNFFGWRIKRNRTTTTTTKKPVSLYAMNQIIIWKQREEIAFEAGHSKLALIR